ncbi:MAG: AMP-dependent synthetase [Rhodothermaceae bacterium]|nr:MAG: AMP-dependent synthetase [Rhodothermaceae bacterium]
MPGRIYTAPPEDGDPILGRTLPSLLYEALVNHPNERAFNQPRGEDWKPFSTDAFREAAEEMALGLRSLGLERGDRVVFYMDSDAYFCLADMGCLIAGLVDVPIYLSHAPEAVQYVIEHAGARVVVVSDVARLDAISAVLKETETVEAVVVVEAEEGGWWPALPDRIGVMTLSALRKAGRARREADPGAVTALLDAIDPHDLATIIYTSGTTGRPKGVMLTHENISSNALTSFHCLGDYRPGPDGETVLSFLPLTHVFARTMYYGALAYGSSIYFTTPDQIGEVMPRVRPTIFATVPRVLEKVYARILEKASELPPVKQRLFQWSLEVARGYELGTKPPAMYRLKQKVADGLVYGKWREALGGRVKYVICGGAALNADLANLYAAAGIIILQGYGLTETSPVITFNRPKRNRAGTVGQPLPGVEVMIADDGEIVVRGPNVMRGYYRNEEATEAVLEPDGWFHTGDIGEFTDDGFLRITDRKKDLFKLSTGKYVVPQPLENILSAEPLIEHAVVVGPDRKYAAALIFPNLEALGREARRLGLPEDLDLEALLNHPRILELYQRLVDRANEGMDPWSTIKRFKLVPAHLSIEEGLLTPTLKVRRRAVYERFAQEIEDLYREETSLRPSSASHST